jgi:hypothetical protein
VGGALRDGRWGAGELEGRFFGGMAVPESFKSSACNQDLIIKYADLIEYESLTIP